MVRLSPYPPELRECAVRMVAEVRPNYPTERAATKAVAAKLGIGAPETVRTWVRNAEITRLRVEMAELRQANAILNAAVAFLTAELERRSRRS